MGNQEIAAITQNLASKGVAEARIYIYMYILDRTHAPALWLEHT